MGRERFPAWKSSRSISQHIRPIRKVRSNRTCGEYGRDRKGKLSRDSCRYHDPRRHYARMERDPGSDRSSRGNFRPHDNNTTTVFIDNIHREVSEYQLGKVVRRFARWSRLYISRKWRSWNRNACAFVDVYHVGDAKRVIDGIRGWIINGCSLWARMEYQGHKAKERKEDRASKASQSQKSSTHIRKEYGSTTSRLSIQLNADKEMKACLSRCAVVSLQEDKNPKEALEFSLSRWPNLSGLLALSRRKFLMLFKSTQEVKDIVNQAHSMGDKLDIRRWEKKDQVEKRRTWVVLRGIPLHAWNKINMRKIAQVVGDVIKIEEEENHFENAEIRIYIETSTLHQINWKIVVKVEEHSFPVSIVEIGDDRVVCRNLEPSESIVQCPNDKRDQQKSQNNDSSRKGGEGDGNSQNVMQTDALHSSTEVESENHCESNFGERQTSQTICRNNAPVRNTDAAFPRKNKSLCEENSQHSKVETPEKVVSVEEILTNVGASPLVEINTDPGCHSARGRKFHLDDATPIPIQYTSHINNTDDKPIPIQSVASIINNTGVCEQDGDKFLKEEGTYSFQPRQTQVEEEEVQFIIPEDFFKEAPDKAMSPTTLSHMAITGTEKVERDAISETPHQLTVVEETQNKVLFVVEASDEEQTLADNDKSGKNNKNRHKEPARDERGKIINAEREAEECLDLLLQLECQVPNPSLTKANLLSKIQAQMSNQRSN